ncbi:hypothetical protein Tco_1377250 [Tanacetum coccineum]
MVTMVPYEAFPYPYGTGDVVLRESYKPKTHGKLYYAGPRSKVKNHMDLQQPPRYSPRDSTPQSKFSEKLQEMAKCLTYIAL